MMSFCSNELEFMAEVGVQLRELGTWSFRAELFPTPSTETIYSIELDTKF